MMKNWKTRLIVPAFAFAACMILGTTQVAQATDLCGGPGFFACKDSGPNGVCQQGEQCDDGNTVNGDGCDTNCMTTACGNGISTAGEECDLGTAPDAAPNNDDISPTASPVAGSSCDTNCRIKTCGNGRTEGGELCDDGNTFNNDGCDSSPTSTFSDTSHPGLCNGSGCGNGITNMNEMIAGGCDDGNVVSGDGCSATCVSEFCGDSISNNAPKETCDDGNTVSNDRCNNCKATSCGDGTTQTAAPANEKCDNGTGLPGSGTNTATCRKDCTSVTCGDGISDIGEACDDGNTKDDTTCSANCKKVPICGDNMIDPGNDVDALPGQPEFGEVPDGETCDNGACACVAPKKFSNGKPCATEAQRAACHADGGTCFNKSKAASCDCTTPASCTPAQGNYDDVPNGCRSVCESASCGDGVTDSGEACDDGFIGTAPSAADDTDACPNGSMMFAMGMQCRMLNTCGDGVPNSDATGGNTCDDGENTAPKTCSNNTTLCSVNTDCGAGNTCGNANATGTCHTTGFQDSDCPNGGASGACACHPHYCGDGATDNGSGGSTVEGCDDGMTAAATCNPAGGSGTACTTTCTGGEICTSGACRPNCAGQDICTPTCVLATCGDGVTQTGEACDADGQNGMNGNNTNVGVGGGADCTKGCNFNTCGDGERLDFVVAPPSGEGCDLGVKNSNSGDCHLNCKANVCGDGLTNTMGSPILEQCDDGNTANGSGNSGGCSEECCYDPTVALPTVAQQIASQQCNLDNLAAGVAGLPDSRLRKRLSRHMATVLKLSSQASAALAAGNGRVLCSAEKRKDRVMICVSRALSLGLLDGTITKTTYLELSQKELNIHGWVQMIRMNSGCL